MTPQIRGRTEDLPLKRVGVGQDGPHKFARIGLDIDERELRVRLHETEQPVRARIIAVAIKRPRRHRIPKILHERPRVEEGGLDAQTTDIGLHLGLDIEMHRARDGAATAPRHIHARAKDQILAPGGRDRGVRDGLALRELHLAQPRGVEPVRDGDEEDGVGAPQRGGDGGAVVEVALDELDGAAEGLEGECGGGGGVARDGADGEVRGEVRVGEDVADEGTALVAGGAEDGEDVGHGCWWGIINTGGLCLLLG